MRETTKDTEAIAQYKSMRETLVYLTHLNNDDTETIMLEKLSKQVEVSGERKEIYDKTRHDMTSQERAVVNFNLFWYRQGGTLGGYK